jgi:uncharacterized protein (DUF2141 family)
MSRLSSPRFVRIVLLAAPLFALTAGQSSNGVLHVAVDNVRDHTGHVHVDLCTQAQFLKDCPISGDAAAHVGLTTVTLAGLKPGRYAAQVFYDQNNNGKVDRAMFGVPKEGVGFSNDARIKLAPPKWEEAVFDYDGTERTIRLKLRYFIGPDAPRSTTAQ